MNVASEVCLFILHAVRNDALRYQPERVRTGAEITVVFWTWGTFITCPARWNRAPLISVSVLSVRLGPLFLLFRPKRSFVLIAWPTEPRNQIECSPKAQRADLSESRTIIRNRTVGRLGLQRLATGC